MIELKSCDYTDTTKLREYLNHTKKQLQDECLNISSKSKGIDGLIINNTHGVISLDVTEESGVTAKEREFSENAFFYTLGR